MALHKESYGLIYNDDGSLCVTLREDDVPFPGVTSFAVEAGTTNLFPWDWNGDWVGTTDDIYQLEFHAVAGISNVPVLRMNYQSDWTGRSWNIGTVGDGVFNDDNTITVSFYAKGEGTIKRVSARLWNITKDREYSPSVGFNVTTEWKRYHFTITCDNTDHSSEDVIALFLYGPHTADMTDGSNFYTLIQVEQKPFATSFTEGTRPRGRFHIPLDRLGFDPATDNWVVAYWKKPIAGHDGTQSGQNLGCFGYYTSDLSVGYIYWGKRLDANAFRLYAVYNDETRVFSSSTTFDPQWYWSNWHFEIIKREGNIISFYVDGVLQEQVTLTKPLQSFNYGLSLACIQGQVHTSLLANILLSRDPSVWTDEYIRTIYQAKKPFAVPPKLPIV